MSWEDQGRQYHGWFGSGTSPNKGSDDTDDASRSAADGLGQRLGAVILGSVAAMPAELRGQAAARLDAKTRARLNALMTTWSRGGDMDRAEFAGQFFGRAASDPVAMGLRTAALTARLSGSPEALRDAAEHLAGALQAVGLDRLSRFLDDAEARANEPSTSAALEKARLPVKPPQDPIPPTGPRTDLVSEARGSVGAVTGGDDTQAESPSNRTVKIAMSNAAATAASESSGAATVADDGTPGNNRAQNKQVEDVVRILRLTKDQRQVLHREVSGQNMGFRQILNVAKDLFDK